MRRSASFVSLVLYLIHNTNLTVWDYFIKDREEVSWSKRSCILKYELDVCQNLNKIRIIVIKSETKFIAINSEIDVYLFS